MVLQEDIRKKGGGQIQNAERLSGTPRGSKKRGPDTERRAVECYSKRIYEKGPRFFAAKGQVLCEGQDRASGSRALGVRLANNGRCCLMQIQLESGSEIKTCIFKTCIFNHIENASSSLTSIIG